jgi:molybdate/tungstate transport system permease protein
MRRPLLAASATLAASLVLVLLVLPVGTLVVASGWRGIIGAFGDGAVLGALLLTAACATAATLVAMLGGTPIAWWLARRPFRGRALVEALLELPLVVPHPVIGLALLVALAPASPIGAALAATGIRIVGTPLGIVLAMFVVSAPLYVTGAREAIARVDERYEGTARTLGDDAWRAVRRVTLPLARRGLVASAVAMWARATSEFGAIVLVAYHPRVASVLAYDRFTTYGLREALPVAGALVVVALVVLAAVRVTRA